VRTAHVDPPADTGVHDGLAYALFLPRDTPLGGVVIVHGADSTKESHFDFARACRAAGLAAVVLDLRGHGGSPGPLDGRIVEDVASVAEVLPAGPRLVRGSSLGGYLALVAGVRLAAAGVVAICPASSAGLRRALAAQRFDFPADRDALDALLAARDERVAAARLGPRLMLQHAAGDEVVPVMLSRALHEAAPGSRLIEVPGGHHRSVQHDPELQAAAVRFLVRAAKAAAPPPG
jgi:pimeloyl-ACP methyl ester carboxylesterase